ncbi:cell division protein FtsA [bacterium]|nr:cell division protein FtsA [bacterium]|tara:strand:- start:8954 stop:10129 length:1176 start_codon:yes stop_codon:yes gene_type:complete
MSRHITTGIDIGTKNTRVVIAERRGKRGSIKVLGTGNAESFGLRHGYITHIDEAIKSISDAVKQAEQEANTRVKQALISAGGLSLGSTIGVGSTLISRVDGEVTSLDIERAIAASKEKAGDLQNKKIIHQVVLQYKLDGKEILGRPRGMRGMKFETRVLFITCIAQHLDDFVHATEEAGIDVGDVAASPIAASLVTLTNTQRIAGCVLVNIGAETVSLAVFENDKPTSLEVFPIGSTDITNDIALGLKIPLEDAERVKLGSLTGEEYPQKKLGEIIQARLSDIFDLVEAHLKKVGRNGLLPAGIVITGGGSGVATIEDLAKASLKLPARIAMSHTNNNVDSKIKDPAWSVAYGLCILGLHDTYTSDFAEISRRRAEDYFKTFILWVKQFLP